MPTGTVKWFNATKGYGFIEPEDGSKDAFVHVSAVERAGLGTLREGQRVRFEIQPGRDGKSSAEELSVIDYTSPPSLPGAETPWTGCHSPLGRCAVGLPWPVSRFNIVQSQ